MEKAFFLQLSLCYPGSMEEDNEDDFVSRVSSRVNLNLLEDEGQTWLLSRASSTQNIRQVQGFATADVTHSDHGLGFESNQVYQADNDSRETESLSTDTSTSSMSIWPVLVGPLTFTFSALALGVKPWLWH